jgi:hypothetical protein
MKRDNREESIQKIKLRTARLILLSTILGCVTATIGYFSYFKPWDKEEQEVIETKIPTQDNQGDSVLRVQNVPVLAETNSFEEVKQGLSGDISELISSFDQSQSDFLDTRMRELRVDTLSDGTIQRKRVPRLITKTSEQAYLEMESAHAHLVSYLESEELVYSYHTVLNKQEEQIAHAYKLFRGNMGSPLYGLKSKVNEGT